jgi:hypothetical protein
MTEFSNEEIDDQGRCEWLTLTDALKAFVLNEAGHQSQRHIRPLHYYIASRLVVEGGFHPSEITPHPPFKVIERSGGRKILEYDPESGSSGERIVLGGLKTKKIDVVVSKPHIGPVIAVSMKGSLGAFRNLTNRMEEAIGDCTNLHISYPVSVYGFFHVIRATVAGVDVKPNDVCVLPDGTITDAILRYHDILTRLEGRKDLREETTKYEAVCLALVKPDDPGSGTLLPNFPPRESPLALSGFFEKMYRSYDLRFVFAAPTLSTSTSRMVWDESSPALSNLPAVDYIPRTEG